MKQESFNAHFAEADHNGEEDWEVRLIDQTDNVEDLRKMSGKLPYFDIYIYIYICIIYLRHFLGSEYVDDFIYLDHISISLYLCLTTLACFYNGLFILNRPIHIFRKNLSIYFTLLHCTTIVAFQTT